MKINFDNLELFWKFIAERHEIYKKKNLLKLPSPWTQDDILQEFKFTNVFRDLDPGTKFVIDKIIPNCNDLPELIFNIIIYRLYNKISTFEFIWIQNISDFNRKIFEEKLRKLSSLWNKVFTNAFIVSGYSFLAFEWDKIARTSRIIDDISKMMKDFSKEILEFKAVINNDFEKEYEKSKFLFEKIKSNGFRELSLWILKIYESFIRRMTT